MKQNEHTLAIVGCGTVGGAAASLLIRDKDLYEQRTGFALTLKYIVDMNFTHAEELGLPERLFEKDLNKVLKDDSISVIVELVGGTSTAKDITEKALSAGKHVVTANKALLAHYGPELFALAEKKGVSLAFEASCGGGIPIVRALYDGLLANRIDAMYGIVNGTCNFILTAMTQRGQTYSEALAEAQRDGLAEADPTLDVSGMDSAHKLTLLGSMAFGKTVSLDSIPVEGIDSLALMDVNFGRELGYIIKLLAVAQRTYTGISCRVRPAFISSDHPLAWISGPFNAVSVYGHAVGHTMYYGRGAGGSPTASAVISDILSISLQTYPASFKELRLWPGQTDAAAVTPIQKLEGRYYIRLMVQDKPGVFAKIASVFADHNISISSVLQKEPAGPENEPTVVPIVIITHTAIEGNVRKALEQLETFDSVTDQAVCISIVDEHEEEI